MRFTKKTISPDEKLECEGQVSPEPARNFGLSFGGTFKGGDSARPK